MGVIIGQDSTGVVSTWAWLRSPLGNYQTGYEGGQHNIEFDSPGFMTAENTYFRCDRGPLWGTFGYLFVTTTVDGNQYVWFRFGSRGSRIFVVEDEETILGNTAVLDNQLQTITITQEAFEGPFGFGQAIDPPSELILEVYDFLPY
jgi:hypothetical protein